MRLRRTVSILFAAFVAVTTHAQTVEILAGAHFTIAPSLYEQLGYDSGYDDADKTSFLLWPTIGVEVTDFEVAGISIGAGAGLQPLYFARIVRSQLNPGDTRYDEFGISIYATGYAEFDVGPISVIAGPALRFHYWTYSYSYDSQISTDTNEFYDGTYVSFGLVAGANLDLKIGERSGLPLSIRAYPIFSEGFRMPITLLTGFAFH